MPSNKIIKPLETRLMDLNQYYCNHLNAYFKPNKKIIEGIESHFYIDEKIIKQGYLSIDILFKNVSKCNVSVFEIFLNESHIKTDFNDIIISNDKINIKIYGKKSNRFAVILKIAGYMKEGNLGEIVDVKEHTIKYENKIFNEIIPMGEECYTSGSIDRKITTHCDIRTSSFPYDYVGHTYIEKISECIDKNYIMKIEDVEEQKFGDYFYFVDKNFEFKYWHDTCHKNINEFTVQEKTQFIDKYKRRYERMYYFLNSNVNLLVLTINHYDNIYNKKWKRDQLDSFKKSLKNPNMHILAINYVDKSFIEDNLTHVFLPFDSDLKFEESKTRFDSDLKNYIKEYLN
jgi:hypothetical protein